MRGVRHALGIRPVYKTVDTCAAEFAARTPYHYSSYDEETEVEPRETPAVIILGSGPNRIGQGIEFDYSCVHASLTLREAGYETVMVNCNPETVSTDYDTSSRLYFEPLTLEDVLEVVHAERSVGPVAGVIVQLGGQTPLGLAQALKDAGVPIVGTSPEAIHLAEERGAFGRVLAEADLPAPAHGIATSLRRGRRGRRPHRLSRCWCGRRTCSAAGAWRSSTTRRCCTTTSRAPPRRPPSTRCSSTASSTTRSRSTSTRSTTATSSTSPASWSTSRRPASTPATRPARCRRSRSGTGDIDRIRRIDRGDRPRRRRARPASTCSTRWPATCSTCSRPTRARRARCRSSSKATARAAGEGGGARHDGRDHRRAARRGRAPGGGRRRHAADRRRRSR